MKVMKFGGTSVGTPQRMKEVAQLITKGEESVFVVLSAMSGTTNTLVEITNKLRKKEYASVEETIKKLKETYHQHIKELYTTEQYKEITQQTLDNIFNHLSSFSTKLFTSYEEKEIIAQGEIISTNMFANLLMEQGYQSTLINALDFMRTDKNGEPDLPYIEKHLKNLIKDSKKQQIYVTQGFICRNAYDEIDNLQRGGSDYTASLIGAAIRSEEVQIWTDIDGMHNNDPRIIDKTKAIRQLHFNEAAELAYFGAKILHPACIQPAKQMGIPVRLKNTMQPEAEGTIINSKQTPKQIKAVAAKDNIIAIKIKSYRLLIAAGFLRKVFEVFEGYQVPIDMLATSEVCITISIENTPHLDDILEQLKAFGTVSIDRDMCIICVVGDLDWNNIGFESQVIKALKDVPVRMISYGGSNYNISFLIKSCDKKQALKCLSDTLFE